MADIIHRIGIKGTPSQVYEAIATLPGLAGWWTEDVRGSSEVGGQIEFAFRRPSGELVGSMKMQVTESRRGKKVVWRCVGGPDEWIGTDLSFELSEEDHVTVLRFGHTNWREAGDFMAHCSMKWATFLLSLRSLVETTLGRPAPRDLKIDNWN